MKSFSLEISNYVDQFGAGKQAARGVEQLLDKGHTTQFTIFPGIEFSFGCKSVLELHSLLLLFIPNCNLYELV